MATTGGAVGLFPRHASLESASAAARAPACSRVDRAAKSRCGRCAGGAGSPPWHGSPVHSPVVAAVVTAALLTSVCGAVTAVRDRPPGRITLVIAAVAAVLTLVQSVLAAVDLVRGSRPPETATYIAYLI